MNLLSVVISPLADKLAGDSQANEALLFDAERCLHCGDKFAQCDACVRVCPTAAIQASGAPGAPPQLQAEACENCFACLPACPTGAFAMEDELPNLLRCLARVASLTAVNTLELICERHPAPALGLAGDGVADNGVADNGVADNGVADNGVADNGVVAIQVRGCLAGLGEAAYLQLAAHDALQHPGARVIVRADACAGCPWQTLPAYVRQQVAQAQAWLEASQRPHLLELFSTPDPSQPLVKRPVYRAGSPPVSRRDLFRGRVQETPLTGGVADNVSSMNPFHQRLRLLNALRRLPGDVDGTSEHPGNSGFAALTVTDSCSACGACARACPSGALVLEKDEENNRFQLTFSLQACLACDVCAHLCPEQAISVRHQVRLEEIRNAPPDELLLAGELRKCQRCGGRFAAQSLEDGFCSVCAFRRRNPFASHLPSVAPRARLKPLRQTEPGARSIGDRRIDR